MKDSLHNRKEFLSFRYAFLHNLVNLQYQEHMSHDTHDDSNYFHTHNHLLSLESATNV